MIKEELDSASQFAEVFGFAGLVSFILLIGCAWALRKWMLSFLAIQERKTVSEIAGQENLVEAQKQSYVTHTQVAENVGQSVLRLEAIAEQNSRVVELISPTNETNAHILANSQLSQHALNKAVRDSLYVAVDMCSDNLDIQRRLKAIADELR